MRYLILSDMHGNWDAFETILQVVDPASFDVMLVLGDLVGYGAAPNQVVNAVRSLVGKVYVIRGNHDKVVSGVDDGTNFNFAALSAARWTTQELTDGNLDYVRELPQGPVQVAEDIAICHGSPLDEDAYVFSNYDAAEVFQGTSAWVTFFGHTHIPSLFTLGPKGVEVGVMKGRSGTIKLDRDCRYLINPGSIGQPRDRDPRASYLSYDSATEEIHWCRVDYPVEMAQERILEAGLPKVLADRLTAGI